MAKPQEFKQLQQLTQKVINLIEIKTSTSFPHRCNYIVFNDSLNYNEKLSQNYYCKKTTNSYLLQMRLTSTNNF